MARGITTMTSVVLALSLGPVACSTPSNDSTSGSAVAASPPAPATPAPAEAIDDGAHDHEAEPAPSPTPPPLTLEPSAPDIADLCQSQCVQRNQMGAVAAEVIDADCRDRCAKRITPRDGAATSRTPTPPRHAPRT